MKAIRIFIVSILCFQISGAVATLSFAVENESPKTVALKRHAEIEEVLADKIQKQNRRVKYPGTLGTEPGIPSVADVLEMEVEFGRYREGVQTLLEKSSGLDEQEKARVVQVFALELLAFAAFSAAVWQHHPVLNPSSLNLWSKIHSLRLEEDLADGIPGLASDQTDRNGQKLNLFVLTSNNGAVVLRLNPTFISGLKMANLSQNANEKTFKTLVKYLAVRQLMQNLYELRLLKRDRKVSLPKIPEPLATEVNQQELGNIFTEDFLLTAAEPAMREEIVRRIESILDRLPKFSDEKHLNELATIFQGNVYSGNPQLDRRIFELLREELAKSAEQVEKAELVSAFAKELSETNWLFSSIAPKDVAGVLGRIIGRAFVVIQLSSIKQIQAQAGLKREQMLKIFDLVRKREKEYVANLDRTLVQDLVAENVESIEKKLAEKRRKEFDREVLTNSRLLTSKLALSAGGSEVDFEALQVTLNDDIAKLSPRPETVQEWLGKVIEAGTYVDARKVYCTILSEVVPNCVLDCNADVDLQVLRTHLDSQNFDSGRIFQDAGRDRSARKYIAKVQKDDIVDWLVIGRLFAFDRNLAKNRSTVTAADILPSEKHALYQEVRKSKILNDYPVLSIELSKPGEREECIANPAAATAPAGVYVPPQYCPKTYKFYEAVDSYAKVLDLKSFDNVTDKAIAALEKQINQNIVKVAKMNDLAEIGTIVKGSYMTQMIAGHFPEFKTELKKFAKKMEHPGLAAGLMKELIGPYLSYVGYAFMGTLLISAIHFGVRKVSAPYAVVFEPLMMELGTFISGYSTYFWPAMIADISWQIKEWKNAEDGVRTAKQLFTSTPQGLSLISYSDVKLAEVRSSEAKSVFMSNMLFNVAFIGGSMVHRAFVGPQVADAVLKDFSRDIQAFKELGLQKGTWDSVKINEAFEAKIRGETIADAQVRLETSKDWLLSQIGRDATWSAEALLEFKPKTKYEKKIVKAMDKYFEVLRMQMYQTNKEEYFKHLGDLTPGLKRKKTVNE